ncbi:MAG: CarD family transcriptional regulator [Oscillospiraceae bacterium]|nr:CarD family transcriptional regulator [Oscillospiraceae bacterium]
MYAVGDYILYGKTGVCEVTALAPSPSGRLCYHLKPLYQNCNISTPVDNQKIFMRPVISRASALRLIDMIPNMPTTAYHTKNLSELRNHYDASMETYRCEDLLELTMSIYAKKQDAAKLKKRVGSVDEHYMHDAEELLFGELSVALGVPRERVRSMISDRLNQTEK